MNAPAFATQFVPPSIEYSNGAVPPVAVIVIVPSATPHSVGFEEATFVMLGAFGVTNTTGLLGFNTIQVPLSFLVATL